MHVDNAACMHVCERERQNLTHTYTCTHMQDVYVNHTHVHIANYYRSMHMRMRGRQGDVADEPQSMRARALIDESTSLNR
jgi:hypothetical protein